MKPSRPLKLPSESIREDQLHRLQYPVACSPKLDGIRCLCTGTEVLSSSLKPIGNDFIRKCLTGDDYAGLDMELIVGCPHPEFPEDDVFNRTSGAVRRKTGEPNFYGYCFDDFREPLKGYKHRWIDQVNEYPEICEIPYIKVLHQTICVNKEAVIAFTQECLDLGYEGVIIRTLSAPYKFGRATVREDIGYKVKPVEDAEGIIIDMFEQQENQNEKTTNELGVSTRSGHAENKVGKNTLGGFVLLTLDWKEPVNVGTIKKPTPDTDMIAWRKDVWENQEKYLGKIVTYKYQKIGSVDAPRQPIMKGFRDESDLDAELVKNLKELYKNRIRNEQNTP